MRKPVTELEIVFEKVEISAEECEQRLNEMFDILFEETLKYLAEKKTEEKMAMDKTKSKKEEGGNYGKPMFN